jgi:hypothetical protein
MQHNSFACSGLAGQNIIMHPDKDVVFVGAANGFQTDYHYFHKTYFWQYVYPGIAGGPIPYEDDAYAELTGKVKRAEVFMPRGSFTSPLAAQVSGRRFPVRENKLGAKDFTLDIHGMSGELRIALEGRELRVPFGFGAHLPGDTSLQDFAKQTGDPYPNGCGAAGVWADERTLVVQSHVIDTLQYFVITCHFGENAAVLQIRPYGIYGYDAFPCSLTHIT